MELIKEVEEILNKYYSGANVPDEYSTVYKYIKEHPETTEEEFKHPIINDDYLLKKYKKHIPKGWYGFEIGNPTPKNWFIVIDKILEVLVENDPEFQIHQIKIKFGGIRFYVESLTIEDIMDISFKIENTLYSKKLVY